MLLNECWTGVGDDLARLRLTRLVTLFARYGWSHHASRRLQVPSDSKVRFVQYVAVNFKTEVTKRDGCNWVHHTDLTAAGEIKHVIRLARWINAPTTGLDLIAQNIVRNHQVRLHASLHQSHKYELDIRVINVDDGT